MKKDRKVVLTIAGSDSSGGAGIQADLKTFMAHGVYGMSVITALTAQNTQGVFGTQGVTPDFLASQLDAVFEDIRPDAVKIGMTVDTDLIEVIAQKLQQYEAKHIVVDPVMVSTSGSPLLAENAVQALTEKLFPLAELITPNVPELERLLSMKIDSVEMLERGAIAAALQYGTAVLAKGGHLGGGESVDVLSRPSSDFTQLRGELLRTPRVPNENTHGTGCTLSSAIAANLAKRMPLGAAVRRAKDYLSEALSDGFDIGRGHGPVWHAFALKGKYFDD